MSFAVTQKHVIATTASPAAATADTVNDMRKKLLLDDNVCADFIDIDVIKKFLGPAVQVINESTPIFDDNNDNSSTNKREVTENQINDNTLADGKNIYNNITREIEVSRGSAGKEKTCKLPSTMTSCVPYNNFCKQTIHSSFINSKNDDSISRIRHSTHPSMDDYEYKYTLHPSCFYNRDTNTNDNDDDDETSYKINSNIYEDNSVLCAMRKYGDCINDEKIRVVKHNNYKRNYNNAKMLRNTAECCARDVNGMLISNHNMTTKIDKSSNRQYECNSTQEQTEKSYHTINSPLKPLSKEAIGDMCSEQYTDKNYNIISGQCNTANSNRLESIYARNNNNNNSRCKEVITENVPIKEYHHTDVVNEMKTTNNETNCRNATHKEIGEVQCTKELNSRVNNGKNNKKNNDNNARYFKPSYAAQSVLVKDASVVLRSHYFEPNDQIATTSSTATSVLQIQSDENGGTISVPNALSHKVNTANTSSINKNETMQTSPSSFTTASPQLLTLSSPHQNKYHLSPAAKMLLSTILYIKALGGFSLLISAKPLENAEYAGYEDCIEMTFLHPLHDKYNEVSFCTTDIRYANANDAFATTSVRLSTFLNKAESTAQSAAFIDSKSSKGKRFAGSISTKRSEEYNNSNSTSNNSSRKVMKVILRAVMSDKKEISMFGKTEIVHVLPALPFQTSLQRDHDDDDDNMLKINYSDICTDGDVLGKRAEMKNVTSTMSKNLSERLQLSANDVLFKYAIDDTNVKRNASNGFNKDKANISHPEDDNTEVALCNAWNEFVTRHSTLYGKELIIAFLEGDMSFEYTNSLPEAAELEKMRYNIFSAAAPLLSEGAMNKTHCTLQSLSDESCYKTCTSENTSAHKNITTYTDTRRSFADDVQANYKYTVVDAEQLANNNNKSKYSCNSSDTQKYSYDKMPSRCSVKCCSDNVFEASRWYDCTNLHPYSPITIAESTLQKHEKQARKRGCKQKASKKKKEHSVYDFRRMRLQRFYFELKNTINTILKCQLDLERQLALEGEAM